ncbi:hypothetical protein B0H65DRAFT_539851 [Neurospora tetraspora]|uniref:Uncharacterized protein n=1 Tax=Neurospora tetraspora TaxID=94610 RepID=A0AAE0MS44_9PEZI|nr:hypothetical protein B0H65DRAFT_539851 [Neurospora tetraspora]
MPQSADTSPGNTSRHRQMPFEPACDFEREVYQQWLAGPPSSQHTQQLGTLGNQEHDFRNSQDDYPANAAIGRIDSGIDVGDDQSSASQEGPHPQQEVESQQERPSHSECPNPEACELSPDMSSTMRRLSIPHNCVFAAAKKELVDKVVHAVMDSVAPRMMELLEEELQRRATQKNKQEDGESERTTTGGEFSKL